jgi:hypothetical protein
MERYLDALAPSREDVPDLLPDPLSGFADALATPGPEVVGGDALAVPGSAPGDLLAVSDLAPGVEFGLDNPLATPLPAPAGLAEAVSGAGSGALPEVTGRPRVLPSTDGPAVAPTVRIPTMYPDRPAGRLAAGSPRGWDPPAAPRNQPRQPPSAAEPTRRPASPRRPVPPPPPASRPAVHIAPASRIAPQRSPAGTPTSGRGSPPRPPDLAALAARFQRRRPTGRQIRRWALYLLLAVVVLELYARLAPHLH